LGGRSLLRKALLCPPKRRKQPERYVPLFLKLFGNNGNGGIHAAAKNETFWRLLWRLFWE
jgi:hypothetical protein